MCQGTDRSLTRIPDAINPGSRMRSASGMNKVSWRLSVRRNGVHVLNNPLDGDDNDRLCSRTEPPHKEEGTLTTSLYMPEGFGESRD